MDVLTGRQGLPLWSDHLRFVRRHRALLAGLITLGLLAGLVWSLRQPASYSATASVVLAPVPVYVTASTLELIAPEVTIDTDAQLLSSSRVLGAVGAALDEDAATAWEHIGVTATPNTHVLHVTVSAPSPSAAADAANAAAAGLVEVRRKKLGALRVHQLRQLRRSLNEHEDLLAREQTSRLLVPARDDLFDQVRELRGRLEELRSIRRRPAEVVHPALPPSDADDPGAEVPVTSGAMLGLLAGCLLGVGRDRAGRAVRPPSHRTPSGTRPGATTRPEEHDHAT